MMRWFACLFALMILAGCSNDDAQVHFAKVEPVASRDNTNGGQKLNAYTFQQHPEKEPETILEYYLAGLIDRDYFMAWFFSDVTTYRNKLFDVGYEIKEKEPLSRQDRIKILSLEKNMNIAIRKFNERNLLDRSSGVLGAAWDARKDKKERKPQFNLSEIKSKGVQANVISDSPLGFLSSMVRYGFTIEPVNFLGN